MNSQFLVINLGTQLVLIPVDQSKQLVQCQIDLLPVLVFRELLDFRFHPIQVVNHEFAELITEVLGSIAISIHSVDDVKIDQVTSCTTCFSIFFNFFKNFFFHFLFLFFA